MILGVRSQVPNLETMLHKRKRLRSNKLAGIVPTFGWTRRFKHELGRRREDNFPGALLVDGEKMCLQSASTSTARNIWRSKNHDAHSERHVTSRNWSVSEQGPSHQKDFLAFAECPEMLIL